MARRPFQNTFSINQFSLGYNISNEGYRQEDVSDREFDLLTQSYARLASVHSKNKVLLKSTLANPTNFHVSVAKEAYEEEKSRLSGIIDVVSIDSKISLETYSDYRTKLEICNEGIGDFLSKIWEKIKAFFRKILEFFGFGEKEAEEKAEKTEKKVKKAKKKIAEAPKEVQNMEVPVVVTEETVKLLPPPAQPKTETAKKKVAKMTNTVESLGLYAYAISLFKVAPQFLKALCDAQDVMKRADAILLGLAKLTADVPKCKTDEEVAKLMDQYAKLVEANTSNVLNDLVWDVYNNNSGEFKGVETGGGIKSPSSIIHNAHILTVKPYEVTMLVRDPETYKHKTCSLVFTKDILKTITDNGMKKKFKINELNKMLDILTSTKKETIKMKNIKIANIIKEANKHADDMKKLLANKPTNDSSDKGISNFMHRQFKLMGDGAAIMAKIAHYSCRLLVKNNEIISEYINDLIDLANGGKSDDSGE